MGGTTGSLTVSAPALVHVVFIAEEGNVFQVGEGRDIGDGVLTWSGDFRWLLTYKGFVTTPARSTVRAIAMTTRRLGTRRRRGGRDNRDEKRRARGMERMWLQRWLDAYGWHHALNATKEAVVK
ncbi:hypothetical protein HPP92_017525 [Vanilla planifolia]|uniref:Uncharacterized protein n=1 Tax=Vanilla planifolia TaxID=51239 RepID=A0A835QCX2_VANPL|nr:hypothetical protein HPP92_017525 [Vanilla planifolia]